MAAAAGHDDRKEPIFKNVNYNLHAHGANTGRFFKLPPNTRIFIPSLNEALYATVSAECLFAQLNLLTIDPACSNIDSLLSKFLSEQTRIINEQTRMVNEPLSYKIYDTAFEIVDCPNILYEPEKSQFTTGIAECPVVVKQTYLKNYKSQTTHEFRQAGDTIIIDNPIQKIIEFNESFIHSGFDGIESMLNFREPHKPHSQLQKLRSGLKKSIIAHLLFPYTKRASYSAPGAGAGAAAVPAGNAMIELPNYITYYDSNKFTTIEHLTDNMGQPQESQIYLENIVKHYRHKIDSDPTLGPDTVITIITFACNKIDASVKAQYEARDGGISYQEFKRRSPFIGLSQELLDDMSLLKRQHVPKLSIIARELNRFFEEFNGRKKSKPKVDGFIKKLLILCGISDATGKIDLDKIGFTEQLKGKVADDVIILLNDYISGLEFAGGSITNKYYLKYLKYKNKYLKSHKSMN